MKESFYMESQGSEAPCKGRLYQAYSQVRKLAMEAGVCAPLKKQLTESTTENVEDMNIDEAEIELHSLTGSLSDLKPKWDACFSVRFAKLKDCLVTVEQYMDLYRCLSGPQWLPLLVSDGLQALKDNNWGGNLDIVGFTTKIKELLMNKPVHADVQQYITKLTSDNVSDSKFLILYSSDYLHHNFLILQQKKSLYLSH